MVNVYGAKTQLSQLLNRVERGEEIVIARNGNPVARLVPIPVRLDRTPGLFAGQFVIADDFDEAKLGPGVRSVIASGRNEIFVSSVTVAEIAIKRSLGKLPGPAGLLGNLVEEGFQELPLLSTHTVLLEELPLHHRDPFDRLLIAQAMTDSLTFASYDQRARAYDVELITG